MRMVETGLPDPKLPGFLNPLQPWILGYTQRRFPLSWSNAGRKSGRLGAALTLTGQNVVPLHIPRSLPCAYHVQYLSGAVLRLLGQGSSTEHLRAFPCLESLPGADVHPKSYNEMHTLNGISCDTGRGAARGWWKLWACPTTGPSSCSASTKTSRHEASPWYPSRWAAQKPTFLFLLSTPESQSTLPPSPSWSCSARLTPSAVV